MDGFHRQQRQQNPGGGSFWYASSSPPPLSGYHPPHPPHPPAAGYRAPPTIYHPHQQSYSNQHPIAPPPQQQHQQWFHPLQQPPPPAMPMLPQAAPLPHHPPHYHGLPPPYLLTQHRYPPPQPHPMAPPPPPAYPPSSQAWGNPSWTHHQVGGYPDRNIRYSSEEDWGAKARAWASHSVFTPVGRMDEHEYAYPRPPLPQSNGRILYHEDEIVAKEAGHLASPPKSYYSSSSIYEQEVPYSYSSSQGNREGIDQRESSLERLHSQFIAPVQMSSVEQPHFDLGNRPAKPSPDACDQPLDFQPRSIFDPNQRKKNSCSPVDPVVAEGTLDQDITTAPFHAWNSAAVPAVAFPPIPLDPSETQFDPAFASQPSLPIHPAPVFGGITAPNFQASVSPVSAPFGLSIGTSLNPIAFPVDANGVFNISERPKKAAVPNWLREEIIKKKSAIASTNSVHSEAIEMEDSDISFRRIDQADNKSVDSKRSTEDEEDDEDEVETARSAAINQEIKCVLTEVLLKVTDELFDEIATKVLIEDEPSAEAVESTSLGNQRVSPVPVAPIPKASATIFVPVKKDSKAVNASEPSSPSSPGGDILGLANYGSDGDDDDESTEAAHLSSRKLDNASHHLETAVSSYGNALKDSEMGKTLLTADANDSVENKRKLSIPGSTERKKNEPSHGKDTGASETFEETSSTNSRKAGEYQRDNAKGLRSSDSADDVGRKHESATGERTVIAICENGESKILSGADQKQERSQNNQYLLKEVEAGLHKNDYENNILGDKLKEKVNNRDKLNEQVGDRSFEQRTNEREIHTRSTSRSDSFKNSRKEILKDKGEKGKDDERKSEHKRDRKENDRRGGKEDRSTGVTRETLRRNSRSKSPVSRGRNAKDTSMNRHGSASSEESCDNSRKRKLQPRRNSLSVSPTRSRKRQVSRSPHSKHSHRRDSPYSSTMKRNRRSRSPTNRRKSSKQNYIFARID